MSLVESLGRYSDKVGEVVEEFVSDVIVRDSIIAELKAVDERLLEFHKRIGELKEEFSAYPFSCDEETEVLIANALNSKKRKRVRRNANRMGKAEKAGKLLGLLNEHRDLKVFAEIKKQFFEQHGTNIIGIAALEQAGLMPEGIVRPVEKDNPRSSYFVDVAKWKQHLVKMAG